VWWSVCLIAQKPSLLGNSDKLTKSPPLNFAKICTAYFYKIGKLLSLSTNFGALSKVESVV